MVEGALAGQADAAEVKVEKDVRVETRAIEEEVRGEADWPQELAEPTRACICRHIPAVQRMRCGAWHRPECAWWVKA